MSQSSVTSHAPSGARSAVADRAPAPTAPAARASEPASVWLFSARGELFGAVTAGALLLVGVLLVNLAPESLRAAGRALEWISLGIGMVFGGRAALLSLAARKFDIEVLMVVGAALAGYMNAPAEGSLLLFLFVLSGALEDLAHARTTRAVEALHTLMPDTSLRLDAASGDWLPVPPDDIAAGDTVRIPHGETIPVDGVVLQWPDTPASASIDQATLTGESMPRVVHPGDEVYAGTINLSSAVVIRASRPASRSSLQRVLDLVVEAQQRREPVQRAIDRLSQPYALGVMAVSTIVFLAWWLIFGDPADRAAYTAMTLLIVASPCAVIISTPTATLAAIGRAARAGVLFKGGQAIERLSRVRAMAMDKTGTLTVGRPRLTSIVPLDGADTDHLLALAAGLEQDSTHPIAAAIRDGAAARSIEPAPAQRATFVPGRGVTGSSGGHEARLGNADHVSPLIPAHLRNDAIGALQAAQDSGDIALIIAWRDQAAVITLSDAIRPGAEAVVNAFHDAGVSPVVMMTGDNARTAARIAALIGVDRWYADMLPEDKVARIEELKAECPGRCAVGLIGDGVNDAPALAAADVSLGVGSIGSDAALESSDVVLLGDDLTVAAWAVTLARRARSVIAINLIFAIGAIVIMAVVVLIGSRTGVQLPLWAGVLGHEGGTLLVVGNSMTLLLFRPPIRPNLVRSQAL